MNKKTKLKTIIRQMVREEVAMAIHEVITELKQPSQSKSQPKKIVEKKSFTNNSVLNDVLNETAQDDGWKTMGGETYDSSKAGDILAASYGDMMMDTGGAGAQPNNGNLASKMGVNPNDPAMDFLKKDYSGLMKKMNKNKNGS